jgi:exopolysaccharide production protein ExoQ
MHETVQLPSQHVGDLNRRATSRRAFPRWLQKEFWLPVLVIFLFCMAVSVERGYAATGGEEVYAPRMTSNSLRQAAFLGLGATGMFLLTLARPSATNRQIAWTVLIPTLSFVGYIFASVLWSDDPTSTMKRAITAALLIVGGLGIGRVWTIRDFAWGILITSSLFLGLGIMVELQYRSFLHVDSYRFSGLFHPAKQSFNCGFLLLASLAIYFSEGKRWMLIIAAIALAFLILTKARTGTAAALLATVWLCWNYTSIRGWLIVAVAGAGFAVASLLFYQGVTGRDLNATTITTMGRDQETADPTKLTGRLPIWKHVFGEFTEQPVLGHGYGAFWTLRRHHDFERMNGWALYHSHSTYLESLANLGIAGFALGLISLLGTVHRCFTLRRQGNGLAAVISAFFLFAFVGGFSEIAFVALEYESLVPMIGIGLMIFAKSPQSAHQGVVR